ncbi:antitermination protein [Providencia stuartii]
MPDLTQSSWSRNWKPFYERLASKCFIEESIAEQAFSKATQ